MSIERICQRFQEVYDLKDSKGTAIGHDFFKFSSDPDIRAEEMADFEGFQVWKNPGEIMGWTRHLNWIGSSAPAASRLARKVAIDTTNLTPESWKLLLDKCATLYQTESEEDHFVADLILFRIALNRGKGEANTYWQNSSPLYSITLLSYLSELGHIYPDPKGKEYLKFLQEELATGKLALTKQSEQEQETTNQKQRQISAVKKENASNEEILANNKEILAKLNALQKENQSTSADNTSNGVNPANQTLDEQSLSVLKQSLKQAQSTLITKDDVKKIPGIQQAVQSLTNTTTSQATINEDPKDTQKSIQQVAVAQQQVEEQEGFWSKWGWVIGIVATAGLGFLAWYFVKKYKDKADESAAQSSALKDEITSLQDEINDLSNSDGSSTNTNTGNDDTLGNNAVIVNTDTINQINEIISNGNQRT